MFEKVLVANRGEIACRVIRTLREMGIRSVAVYSEADRDALHVRMADEAYCVGPAASSESYLVIENLIDACKKSGAEAVHPGYGFLSENAAFVRACKDAGITFIGPEPEAMEAMGSKTAAREKMIAAGVPVVPGVNAGSVEELQKAADELGYPVMLKASAGGGGKGMRLVEKPEDLAGAYERARSEAKSAFGDETVYLEKAIVQPRHIEIQVLGDKHGGCVHLFERDCSIQRRHQKVVEETPSPAEVCDDALVAKMGEVAVRAAKAVDYHGAGTVEFLMAADGSFYFLEMNTRLQVEHPITELITGMDLVREQVRVAAGEPLGYTQDDIQRRGAAIQCRVYAEDPATGFLPSPGTIEVLRQPHGPGVRDDSGAYGGAEIPSFYDPLVSKLCVWAPTRELAVQRMRRALTEYVVTGIQTNLPFHLRLMEHEEFVAGQYDTGFIDRHRDALLKGEGLGAEARALTIAAAVAQAFRDADAAKAAQGQNGQGPGQAGPSPWRMGAIARLH
ncbi:MAG TPA: acetyl-CoA carboxylase biotin carboxylase subunit [Polyangiaceae bacterium LLY-WYZ-15_(1-7)]|nr:acetyl-CoA carboxylase biotin carboxylase subunit [Myxococcales bacterium]MAT25254.1 acetyl-CoA carboxylase biotin carboxylase subunit [Sandaracinus sp.]HJK92773.1 acetyl-CoA carboxylase biotin carboxylase subunit [Polyangiaceae bacterium LLY-WYZ-15_(1-7)]MBJ70677.1 acetyl-CoA carboxylase biotin carboxylase subunit [Sandaracinus sp.]HJL03528.1 acetyl-CoA carboxylase biotin carboxylase subunit [Polyangiaceae bacterium LLY-WYZ-15_(1-7)]